MRRSSTVTVALGLVSLALVACSAIIGTRDLTLVDGDAGGGGGDDQGRADGSVDASDATTQPPTATAAVRMPCRTATAAPCRKQARA